MNFLRPQALEQTGLSGVAVHCPERFVIPPCDSNGYILGRGWALSSSNPYTVAQSSVLKTMAYDMYLLTMSFESVVS